MKTLLAPLLVTLALFIGCAPVFGGDDVAWPGVEYTSVKAFLFDGAVMGHSLIVDGKISPTVEKVARLSAKQTQSVLAAIRPVTVRARAMCYNPHHAFVFFDQFSRPVAHLEICYECGNIECSPPLPAGTDLDFAALAAVFKEAGIPIPGDKEFSEFVKSTEAMNDAPAVVAESFDQEPAPENTWPWKAVATVKLYEMDASISCRNPLVHLGKINGKVVREATLTAAQIADVWKHHKRPEWQAFKPGLEAKVREEGKVDVRKVGGDSIRRNRWSDGSPTVTFHGLVCFDKDQRPIGWLEISFSDGTYRAVPHEGTEMRSYKRVWHIELLKKAFEDSGVLVPAEYKKRVEESLKR